MRTERKPDRRVGPHGRYVLQRPIGATRFASYWHAADRKQGNRPVLIEQIRLSPPTDPWAATRLRKAIALVQSLPPHQSALEAIAAWTPDARRPAFRSAEPSQLDVDERSWLLVNECFEDATTLDHLVAFEELPLGEAFRIAADVGDTLAALHARGLVHGALEATNVLIDRAGTVKVLDAVVGAVGTMPATAAPPTPADDVTALARLVRALVPAVATPHEVAAALEDDPGRRPSIDELVVSLRGTAREHALVQAPPTEDVVVLPVEQTPPDVTFVAGPEPAPRRRGMWLLVAASIIAVVATIAIWAVVLSTPPDGVADVATPLPTLSLRPSEVAVPSFFGRDPADARQLLTALGLEVRRVEYVEAPPDAEGVVLRTRPRGGTMVVPGTGVVLLVGDAAARPTTSPSPSGAPG